MNIDKKILVIGGGSAGARVTQDLAKAGFKHVTLIDKKDYFEVTYATMRAVAQPELGTRSRRQYSDFIEGQFINESVQELTSKTAVLANGSSLDYDVAVVATGSSYATFPIGKSETAMSLGAREAEILKANKQLGSAQNILIIGGGIVGVELAGEIADHYPAKSVTLAQGADRLLVELKPKASEIAATKLQSLGVNILYNTRVSAGDEHHKNADLVYTCIGLSPNTDLMNKHFASTIDEKGRVKVDMQFRVQGTENIYALGDCSDIPEGKMGFLADLQAAALAKNIIASVKGKSPKDYKLKA